MPLPQLEEECFFIAPIGDDDSPERRRSDGVLNFIVKQAAEDLGLQAVRSDDIAEPGQITLQVVQHVLEAKAAVVDLTYLNANVFYEMAIRHTARLPVALIAEKGTKLPFDIAQMRTIFFDHQDLASAHDCRRQITEHLREALENGSVDSPIATTLDVQAMQMGSVVERNVAELVTTVEDLGRAQSRIMEGVERLMLRRDRHSLNPKIVDDLGRGWVDFTDYMALDDHDEDLVEVHRRLARPIEHLLERNGWFGRRVSTRSSRDTVRRAFEEGPGVADSSAPGTRGPSRVPMAEVAEVRAESSED